MTIFDFIDKHPVQAFFAAAFILMIVEEVCSAIKTRNKKD
jgi:hypothetical protein